MLAAVELGFDHPRTAKPILLKIPPDSDRVAAAFRAIGDKDNSL